MIKIITLFLCIFSYQLIHAQSWYELASSSDSLSANGAILSISNDANGNIYAAGYFTNSSSNRYVAKWDGNTWNELGGLNSLGANGFIRSICLTQSNNIYVGGAFTNGSGKRYVAKWDGNAWTELGGLNALAADSFIFSLCTDASSNIYAAGLFTNSSGKNYVAKFDGTNWIELGGLNGLAANNEINSLCTDASGNLYAAGNFTNLSGNYYVAKWNGLSWTELGGLNSLAANNSISTICTDANGNIYVAGNFTNSNGHRYVAKWDGNSWSELGGLSSLAANYLILSICADAANNIYAAGGFTNVNPNPNGHYYVAKFNGTNWSELGGLNGLNANGAIESIFSNKGNFYAAGIFSNGSNALTGKRYVAKYGGATGIQTFLTNDAALNISPNPTITSTTIILTKAVDNATIKLINLTGQIIIEKQNQTGDHFTLDISQQAQGIYFLEVRQQDNVWRTKLVKQ
jgi:Secretion system C-terminal sorting domain